MNSFSSELGVQFGTSLEAPHVIDVEAQVQMDFSYFLVFLFQQLLNFYRLIQKKKKKPVKL